MSAARSALEPLVAFHVALGGFALGWFVGLAFAGLRAGKLPGSGFRLLLSALANGFRGGDRNGDAGGKAQPLVSDGVGDVGG